VDGEAADTTLPTSARVHLVAAPDTSPAPSQPGRSSLQTLRSPGVHASDNLEAAIRSAVSSRRAPLPPKQRVYKLGTTGFMLAMHVGAVAALLPRFWSWQAVAVMAVLYWTTVLGVTLGLPACWPTAASWHPSGWSAPWC